MSDHRTLQQQHLRRNFFLFFSEGVFAVAGFTTFGVYTIMPGLIHEVVLRLPALQPVENRLVTALGICMWGLSPLVGFFSAGYFETQARRMHVFVKWGVVMRGCFLLVVLATFFLPVIGGGAYLAVLFGALVGYGLVNGMMMPQWYDYIGRLIPVNRRGILFGGRDALGNLIGLGLLATFPFFTRTFPFPANYGVLQALVLVLLVISYILFISMREIPYQAHELRPRPNARQQLRNVLDIVRHDADYRHLMIATVIGSFAAVSTVSLYTMKAITLFKLTGPDLAQFTSRFAMCSIIAYTMAMPLAGLAGDRWGYKRLFYLNNLLALAILTAAILSKTPAAFLRLAFLNGVLQGTGMVTTLNFPLEFAPENRRPSYIAVRFLFTSPFMVMPFVGGWLADHWGYNMVFGLAILFIVPSFIYFYMKVIDPRHRRPAPGPDQNAAPAHSSEEA